MSRTRIPSKMESSKINFSLLSGINAYSLNDANTTIQFFNKSLQIEKQCNVGGLAETNNSLLKTLNFIDSNIDEYPGKTETYTLDDLLDLENEDLNKPLFYDGAFDDETLFMPSNDEVLMETALASPLSSSSDESCDLDELLFLNEPSTLLDSDMKADIVVQSDQDYVEEPQLSLEELIQSNGTDLSALCSLLFQNKGTEASELTTILEQYQLGESLSSQSEEELSSSSPVSPATSLSSESEAENSNLHQSVRYKPYKTKKTPEQKQRKKAQNRTAATRYRIKKKDELKIMTDEADKLEEKNNELKGKVDGLRNEIDYLKNLMLDVIKARLAKGATPEALLSAAALMLK